MDFHLRIKIVDCFLKLPENLLLSQISGFVDSEFVKTCNELDIGYDFKPASVDKRSKGKVEIGEGNSLSVTVPHSNGTTETNYK